MLDRASLERLSKSPEKNAPMLNVALAEEGPAQVLLALARSAAVGPEAIEVVADRMAREGEAVGKDPQAGADEIFVSPLGELQHLVVAHPRASDAVRDALVEAHLSDPYFVLAAAGHPHATLLAIERAIDWPAASPAHDRLWLALIDSARVPPLTLEEWASDESPRRREAAARIARDERLLVRLGADRDRRVRRAVASNRLAGELRATLAAADPAPEVRARAAGALSPQSETGLGEGARYVESARFAASLRAMRAGGVLAPDVLRALSGGAGPVDDEGHLLAGQVLPRAELGALVEQVIGAGLESTRAACLAAGLALRRPVPYGADDTEPHELEHTEVVYDTVKALAATTTAESRLTGKARLAAWAAEAIARGHGAVDAVHLLEQLTHSPLAAERMVLARGAALHPALVSELCRAVQLSATGVAVPPALLELAWADAAIDGALLVEIASRLAKAKRRAEELPEDEVDLDPALRPLELLERVVLAATRRVNVAPRAALPVVALDARRVRYVLAAMPQWKGRLEGGRLARVLRQHAGALSAAQAESRARSARVETRTERILSELELGIALAVGHLTVGEVTRRIQIGRQVIDDGLSLASGAEARAALEGPACLAALLSWATKGRTKETAALVVWLLLERFDRERAPSLVASSLDAVGAAQPIPGKPALSSSLTDALATLERRHPGRLETIHPQSPRGRATLASAIARAYRALGGTREERAG